MAGPLRYAGTAAAWTAGLVLAGVLGAAAALRRGRPLHPRGTALTGTLELVDDAGAPGAGELGAPVRRDVVVRISRGGGLPPPWPDVAGLAIRWFDGDTPQDLLLASTGLSLIGRYVLQLRLSTPAGAFSTIMPLRSREGPVVLGARTAAYPVIELLSATPAGPWRHLGRLTLGEAVPGSPRFDPTANVPGGLGTYRWEDLLRARAYAAARRWGRSTASSGDQ